MVGTHNQHMSIHQWPRVLLVHLKRWLFNERTNTFNKINEMLHFPATYTHNTNTNYSLRSIVVHIGQAHGGHYVAFTRDDRHDWLLYNDSASPVQVSEQTVLQQCPYMLFYEHM